MSRQLPQAYFNGKMLPLADVHLSPLDRGFLFGEGIYEVIAVFGGQPFHLDAHLTRLARSCAMLELPVPDNIADILCTLIDANGGGDQSVYLQLTRGVSDSVRNHVYPVHSTPTVFAMCQTLDPRDPAIARNGVRAITLPDQRWSRCEIKSTSLLANTMARQAAHQAGAVEAILIRDEQLTEGAASTIFVVRDGVVCQPPPDPQILPGTTAQFVATLLARDGRTMQHTPVTLTQLREADEIWAASSTRGVLPITILDDRPIGAGVPGPLWLALDAHYTRAIYPESKHGG